jgi:hypothetical protein
MRKRVNRAGKCGMSYIILGSKAAPYSVVQGKLAGAYKLSLWPGKDRRKNVQEILNRVQMSDP